MDFTFQLFEPKRAREKHSSEPTVQITPNGRILFNKAATELLAGNKYCKLGYDATSQAIGVLPLSDLEINSFSVRYTTKGAYIGAKRFFKHFDVLPQGLVAMPPIQTGNFIGLKV